MSQIGNLHHLLWKVTLAIFTWISCLKGGLQLLLNLNLGWNPVPSLKTRLRLRPSAPFTSLHHYLFNLFFQHILEFRSLLFTLGSFICNVEAHILLETNLMLAIHLRIVTTRTIYKHTDVLPKAHSLSKLLAVLKIIAWHQARSTILPSDFCLPPSIILVPQYCKDISFRKAQLLRDGCLVHIKCTSYRRSASFLKKRPRNLPKCRIGRPSLLNCLTSATLLLLCLDDPPLPSWPP